jgi:hypothetical protein
MALTLTITKCFATPTTLVVYFSEALNAAPDPDSAASYAVLQQPTGTKIVPAPAPSYNANDNSTTFQLPAAAGLTPGSWLSVSGTVEDQNRNVLSGTFYVQVGSGSKLTIRNCVATPTSVVVYFSEPLDTSSLGTATPAVPNNDPNFAPNYTIQVQATAAAAAQPLVPTNATYDAIDNATVLQIQPPLTKGTWLAVQCSGGAQGGGNPAAPGVSPASGGTPGTDPSYVRVNGDDKAAENAKRATQAAEDAVAYPVMTEQVGVPPSSSYTNGGGGGGGGTGSSGGGRLLIGQTANQAIADVLGWKLNDNDPTGFIGALTQSFSLKDVEGHVEATWTPRTYAVQTDLSGGITGAQASMYTRAQDALQQSSPLIDGLYPLNPDSDSEMVTALKDIVTSQFAELVNELGYAGGPRISRVDQYFGLLLGDIRFFNLNYNSPAFTVISDPDKIKGTMGRLRDELQVQSFSRYVNTVEDEQDVTNFRILSDYLTLLAQSWVNNVQFFGLDTTEAFLGTQLVLLSRQLSVVGETVGEVRFTLDSVFIGPAERQTLQLELTSFPAIFIEDLLLWVESFAKDEGPQLIQNAGKLGVGDGFLPIVDRLAGLVHDAKSPVNQKDLPDGYRTIRVKHSIQDLEDQLGELARLAGPVALKKPPKVFDYDEIVRKIHEEINIAVPGTFKKP